MSTPEQPSPKPLQDRTLAVVGAGLAGVSAALRLQRAGARVVVLEARDRVGGKLAVETRDGFQLDRVLQVVADGDRELLGLAAEAGAADRLLPLRPLVSAQLHRARVVPCDARSLTDIARTPGVSWRDRARLLRLPRLMERYAPLLDATRPERAADLDYRSVRDFARLYLGRSVFERFVAPRVCSESLGSADEISRVLFLLQWQAELRGGAGLGVAAGGLGEIAEAAAQRLELRLGARAQQVKELGEGRLALESSAKVGGGTETLEVDGLVLATSPAEARRIAASLVTPAERDFLEGVRFGPRIGLSVALERPVTGLPELVRFPDAELRPLTVALVEPGVPGGGRAPEGRGLVTAFATAGFAERYSPELSADAGHEARVEAALLGSLDPVFPLLRGALGFTRLTHDPAGVPRFEVGAYRELARFEAVQQDRRALGRRLYFAGDYRIGPRSEDAVVSGRRAADGAIRDLAR